MPWHAPLQHELRDDAVESAALVSEARLASAQLFKSSKTYAA